MSRLMNLMRYAEQNNITILALNDTNKNVFCKIESDVTPYVVWSYDDNGDVFKGIYAENYEKGKAEFLYEAFYIS